MRKLLIIMILIFVVVIKAEWSEDPAANNLITNLTGDQTIPKIAQNPDGSSYIGWWSNHTGNYNMRLQYLDSDGNIVWEENGILVSDHTQMSWLTDWDMTADLDGNVIMAFNDIREAEDQLDIFAYKITSEGEFVWSADGINLSNGGFNAAPKVTITEDNNAIYAWSDDTTIKVMSVSPGGNLNWENPILINEPDTSNWPQVMAAYGDGSEGNFLLKYFVNVGPYWAPDRYVYMMKYDANGNEVWDSPAVVSDAFGITAWTQIFSWSPDGNGGAVIAWHDDRYSENVSRAYVQHITSDGTAIFDDGVLVGDHGSNNQYYPQTVYQPEEEMIYVYWEETDANQNNSGILGQKVNIDGELLYGNAGISVSPVQTTGGTIISLRPAGDNVTVIYSLYPWSNFNHEQLLADCFDPDGEGVWDETLIISDMQTSKMHVDTADFRTSGDGFIPNDGFIIGWGSEANGVYAQRYNNDGTLGIPSQTLPAPYGLAVEIEIYTVTISWEMPGDRDLIGFNIYIDNNLLSFIDEPEIREITQYYGEPISFEFGISALYDEGESQIAEILVEISEYPLPPMNLIVDNLTGFMDWEEPIPPPERELLGYTVFLDSEEIAFTQENEYQLTELIADETYLAGVAAEYTDTTSAVIEVEFIYTPVGVDEDEVIGLIGNCYNYPNPFNPETRIRFYLTGEADVSLKVYNIRGQLMEMLTKGFLSAGQHQIIWQPVDLPSGIYYYKLTAGEETEYKQLLLLK